MIRLLRHGRRSPAFTLVELMVVVSIIGILASIAIPKFSNMVRKAQEGSLKGSLGSLRSALSIYSSDNEGIFPSDDLASLTVNSKYLAAIPCTNIPPYHNSTFSCGSASVIASPSALIDSFNGLWFYDSNPVDANWGTIWVGCTHTDTKGTVWTNY